MCKIMSRYISFSSTLLLHIVLTICISFCKSDKNNNSLFHESELFKPRSCNRSLGRSADVNTVIFALFNTPNNPYIFEKLALGNKDSIVKSNYMTGKHLKVLIHGFHRDMNADFPLFVKNEYLKQMVNGRRDKFNLLVVDWGKLSAANHPNYPLEYANAVRNTFSVGKQLANFLLFLKEEGVIRDFSDVHVIGFSLGGHVAGVTGWHTYSKSNRKLGRITGLDPAGPYFDNKPLNEMLDPSDAQFVDVIHTNAGNVGYNGNLGHVDFYPNGGKLQWGCGLDLLGFCSHKKAATFFQLSISNPRYLQSCKCKDKSFDFLFCKFGACATPAAGGDPCLSTTRGIYYVAIIS